MAVDRKLITGKIESSRLYDVVDHHRLTLEDAEKFLDGLQDRIDSLKQMNPNDIATQNTRINIQIRRNKNGEPIRIGAKLKQLSKDEGNW